MTPKRIQYKRTKGWRKPDGVVYVGRPSKWGNPWKVSEWGLEASLELYRGALENGMISRDEIIAELRGKDLGCWCPLDKPCHADVLLELANAKENK